jgi:aminopeptidase N
MNLPKDRLEPIMTKGDYVSNVGSNAYAKAAAGLSILRETILGRELFDFSFREYARRWAFKHPTPADLFRTMEDASGSDLDWFWRGWYFGTDAVDISLDSVRWAKSDSLLNGKEVNLYELRFSNKGGMVMPVIIEWTYKDGTKEIETVPVTVWGKNENAFTKVFKKEKEVTGIMLDPKKETADINPSNSNWPVKEMPTKFQIYKGWSRGRE